MLMPNTARRYGAFEMWVAGALENSPFQNMDTNRWAPLVQLLWVISVTTLVGNQVAEIDLCLNVDVWIKSFGICGNNRRDQQTRIRNTD
jgi:hypothetical protein